MKDWGQLEAQARAMFSQEAPENLTIENSPEYRLCRCRCGRRLPLRNRFFYERLCEVRHRRRMRANAITIQDEH